MEFDTRLKIITAGLILAAIAVGYLIFTQRFSAQNRNTNGKPVVQFQPSPTPVPLSPSPSPATLGETTPLAGGVDGPTTKGGQPLPKTGVSGLPKTGAPVSLVLIFSASAAVAGWFLRKYPH